MQRGPFVKNVVFRNTLSPSEALDLCIGGDGEVDIATEVSPTDAQKVKDSKFARLEACDANRVLVGVFKPAYEPRRAARRQEPAHGAEHGGRPREGHPRGHARLRLQRRELTPPWCAGAPDDLEPIPLDPARAKEMFSKVKWPRGRALKIATGGGFAGIAKLIADDIEQNLGITVEIMVGDDSARSQARARSPRASSSRRGICCSTVGST